MPGVMAPSLTDPTVCDATEKARIEFYTGVSLRNAEPEALRFVVERSKQAGNEAFRDKNYKEAIKLYSQAIAGEEGDHALYGNRSAAYLAVGLYEQALWDARKAIKLSGDWGKGYYRLGCAQMALSQWAPAVQTLEKGLELSPDAADMATRLAQARARLDEEQAARHAAAATERRGLVLKLRAARREDQKLSMLNQFKQSMAAPDWELEDLEWRPTWLPSMRLTPLDPGEVLADPKRALLLRFINSLADLAHPKGALRTLNDAPRLAAFQRGIQGAMAARPGGHALVLSSGGGVLALMAASAGAGRVTAVERSRMLYRMAKQIVEANCEAPGVGQLALVDRSLMAVEVQGEAPPPEVLAALRQRSQSGAKAAAEVQHTPPPATAAAASAATGTGSTAAAMQPARQGKVLASNEPETAEAQPLEGGEDDFGARLPKRADILISDLLDHSVLGMGLLPAVDYAAQRLLAPGAAVVPRCVRVFAQLIELRLGPVSGFDLSPMDSYRWYPGAERVQLDRMPHRPLSAPFAVHTLDLQARVATVQATWALKTQRGASSGDGDNADEAAELLGESSNGELEFDCELEVETTAGGRWNAVAFWFDLSVDDACTGTSAEDAAVSSYSSGGSGVPEGSSWGQAVQYIDGIDVAGGGGAVRLRFRQDRGQLVFTSAPPQCRPRHALVPRWHYDMVLDAQRNEAYDAAIARAVARKRDSGCRHLLTLDMGAGSSLLSMMAARAGADAVCGAEVSGHMCDVGEECALANGFLGRVSMVDRDVRRMDVERKPDGTPPELPRRADLAVFEVFDSGLIGEGVLHLLAAARAKLLTADAALVPCGATVYCQPVQMRTAEAAGFDVRQANRWRWRPDYEGVELARCQEEWAPLADPLPVFTFDFYDAHQNMRPAEAQLAVEFTRPGVFNAVVTWFELFLDEDTSLSTSPYAEKGPTWQQAVQWVREVEVCSAGESLVVTARHDTYSISYAVEAQHNGGEEALERRHTDVPLQDPAWGAAHEALQAVNSQLVRACVQSPLEYRAVAQAAVALAARPHDVGADAAQAAEFCVKMMG